MNNFTHKEFIKNDYVTLEKLTPQNILEFKDIFDPQIWRWYSVDILTFDDLLKMYEPHFKAMEKGLSYIYLIRDNKSGNSVGSSRYIDIDTKNKSLEIGSTWITPKWQRTYINTATKLATLENAFEDLQVNRVSLQTDSRNQQSIEAIKRIGAKYEGTLRNHRICQDGSIRDSVVFSITPDDWHNIKKQLHEKLERKYAK